MLFVALANAHPGTGAERMQRRVDYQYPESCNLLAEYWLQTDRPSVIVVFESDRIEAIMQAVADWDDLFDVEVYPAVDYLTGIEITKSAMLAAA
jgi:hypothetical protein